MTVDCRVGCLSKCVSFEETTLISVFEDFFGSELKSCGDALLYIFGDADGGCSGFVLGDPQFLQIDFLIKDE